MASVQFRERPAGPARRAGDDLHPAARRRPVAAVPDAGGADHPAPPLRLTRRGRRLVAGLSIGAGLGIAVLAGAADDGDPGALRLAGGSSVVVQSGDTLWSIASETAPGEDTRAVVDAIMAVNDLEQVELVPGQVLQLP